MYICALCDAYFNTYWTATLVTIFAFFQQMDSDLKIDSTQNDGLLLTAPLWSYYREKRLGILFLSTKTQLSISTNVLKLPSMLTNRTNTEAIECFIGCHACQSLWLLCVLKKVNIKALVEFINTSNKIVFGLRIRSAYIRNEFQCRTLCHEDCIRRILSLLLGQNCPLQQEHINQVPWRTMQCCCILLFMYRAINLS